MELFFSASLLQIAVCLPKVRKVVDIYSAVGSSVVATLPQCPAKCSISDRLCEMGAPLSDKMAILGGRVCGPREIDHCRKSIIIYYLE